MKLNKEQYRAAVHLDGPMLVLAGPGSGKTHLLVERIRMMIEDSHIPPESILVITFSKKAARQMQTRFLRRIKDRSYPVTFGTFHAVFYHILREHDPDISRLITEEEQMACLRHAVKSCAPLSDLFYRADCEDQVLGLISSYRNFGEEQFCQKGPGRFMTIQENEDLTKVVKAYSKKVADEKLIDFDDMIVRCKTLLYKHESVLRRWKMRYRYFLVDEFQDINEAQYDVLRLLAGDAANVFAVGDDDQSIYAFRGARPQLMSKFLEQYKGCRRVVLAINYRCAKNIIGAADTLIRNNTQRLDRPMQRHLPSKPDGCVEIINTESTDVQAVYVCDRIEELISRHGYKKADIAVLYRSDHCAKLFERYAMERGIGIRKNNERKETDSADAISLMTAHASKGLEFSCVFIIGLQEGLFPHHKNLEGEAVEEERRLMYVAMTRARERLFMVVVSTGHGKRPSRFVPEAALHERYITERLWITRI